MSAIESWMLGYLVNAVWQVAVVCGAAWLLARFMRRLGPQAEHRIWCSALVAQVLLPAVLVRPVSLLWSSRGTAEGMVTVTTGTARQAASCVYLRYGWRSSPWRMACWCCTSQRALPGTSGELANWPAVQPQSPLKGTPPEYGSAAASGSRCSRPGHWFRTTSAGR